MIKEYASKFVKEEDGAGLLEYLFLAALAAVIALFLFPKLREVLMNWFNSMMGNVDSALSPDGSNSYQNPGNSDAEGWE